MIQLILDNANRAIDKEHLVSAVEDLSQRVEDWKALKLDQFGDLLRYGTFTILKGDSGKDAEREVRIILSNTTAQSYLLGSRRSSFTGSVIHLLSANSHRSWSWKQSKDSKYISVFPTPTQVAHPLELLTPTHSASTKTLEFNTPPPRPRQDSSESFNTSPSKSKRSISSIFSLSKSNKHTSSPITPSIPQQRLSKAHVRKNSGVGSEDGR